VAPPIPESSLPAPGPTSPETGTDRGSTDPGIPLPARGRRPRKLERTPSGVSWLIDGHVILTAPASQVKSPARQPALAMNMALQSENLQGTTGASSPRETMTVDWFEQFSWNG
jgi:hypothetical protein